MHTAIERSFETNELRINYAEFPSPAAPLILLHGGSASWRAFESILPELAVQWHIYAPDFRGHGKSSWAPGTYRLQNYVDDTIALLQACVKEPAAIFGHSLGGAVALQVAAQYPAGVRAVVVGDAPLTSETWRADLGQGRERVLAWRDIAGGQKSYEELLEILKNTPTEVPGQATPVPMREVHGEDAPVYAWLAANLLHNDPDMLTALFERFEATTAGYEMTRVLPSIQSPVLLMQADPTAGGLMTDREVEQALPLLQRGQHVRLAGVSHVLHNERKEPVVQALAEFFKAVA